MGQTSSLLHPAVVILFSALLLSGCASAAPDAIRRPLPGSPGLAEVKADHEIYLGQQVRWGGVLTGTENRAQETWLEIVIYPLERGGRPIDSDNSAGRFLARVPSFLDPSMYAKERLVTVSGIVKGMVTRKIGNYPYRYVLIQADVAYLWERLPDYRRDRTYYDPFWWDPWYPWGYPYHHPPYPH